LFTGYFSKRKSMMCELRTYFCIFLLTVVHVCYEIEEESSLEKVEKSVRERERGREFHIYSVFICVPRM